MTKFTVTIRPRYGEVDRMGVVHHVHYLSYFEVGRTEFMRARGMPYAELEDQGYLLPVVETGVRHRRPAHYDEELTLAVRVSRLSRAGVTFEYDLLDVAGRQLADGFTRLGCLAKDTWRPAPLPDHVRRALAGREAGSAPSKTP